MIIDIVTPTYNRDRFLAETLESVITQKTNGKINYYIMDGGSTDNTIEIAITWKARAQTMNSGLTMDIEVGNDKGMYDAIFKGFNKGSGDIMAWINSDDIYMPHALNVVSQVFQDHPDIEWISGIPSFINTQSSIIKVRTSFPLKTQSGIKRGIYNYQNTRKFCPSIQQDCVFWRRHLWNTLDKEFFLKFRNAKYAGDHLLWSEFAKHTPLFHVESILSGFRIHDSQLTTNLSSYLHEMEASQPNWMDIFRSGLLNLPLISPKLLTPISLEKKHKQLCSRLGTGYIFWDRASEKWIKQY